MTKKKGRTGSKKKRQGKSQDIFDDFGLDDDYDSGSFYQHDPYNKLSASQPVNTGGTGWGFSNDFFKNLSSSVNSKPAVSQQIPQKIETPKKLEFSSQNSFHQTDDSYSDAGFSDDSSLVFNSQSTVKQSVESVLVKSTKEVPVPDRKIDQHSVGKPPSLSFSPPSSVSSSSSEESFLKNVNMTVPEVSATFEEEDEDDHLSSMYNISTLSDLQDDFEEDVSPLNSPMNTIESHLRKSDPYSSASFVSEVKSINSFVSSVPDDPVEDEEEPFEDEEESIEDIEEVEEIEDEIDEFIDEEEIEDEMDENFEDFQESVVDKSFDSFEKEEEEELDELDELEDLEDIEDFEDFNDFEEEPAEKPSVQKVEATIPKDEFEDEFEDFVDDYVYSDEEEEQVKPDPKPATIVEQKPVKKLQVVEVTKPTTEQKKQPLVKDQQKEDKPVSQTLQKKEEAKANNNLKVVHPTVEEETTDRQEIIPEDISVKVEEKHETIIEKPEQTSQVVDQKRDEALKIETSPPLKVQETIVKEQPKQPEQPVQQQYQPHIPTVSPQYQNQAMHYEYYRPYLYFDDKTAHMPYIHNLANTLGMNAKEISQMSNQGRVDENERLKRELNEIAKSLEMNRSKMLSVFSDPNSSNYQYTTLEQTKRFIEQNRPKPLTMDHITRIRLYKEQFQI